jgi:hypothetical protein
MRKSLTFLSLFVFVLFSGCKKESNKRACWMIVDFSGTDVTTICNKTEAELLECANNGTCGYGGTGITSCNYYKVEGEKYCWKIGTNYINDITENKAKLLATCFFGGATPIKIDCNQSCRLWYHREKKTYKPANTITYSQVRAETFCADTLSKLYQGRQIIKKETADSLIVIQFSNNGTNW